MVFELVIGAADSPVILHVPHAARELTPAARAGIVLDDVELEAELDRMTDAYTDVIARQAAGSTAWLFINVYSRLVVDPERFPDEREEMRAVGMGAVYTHTSLGDRLRADDPGSAETLLSGHFRPYAAAFTALVDERLEATGARGHRRRPLVPEPPPSVRVARRRPAAGRVHRYRSVPHPARARQSGHRPRSTKSGSTARSPAATCRSSTSAPTGASRRS